MRMSCHLFSSTIQTVTTAGSTESDCPFKVFIFLSVFFPYFRVRWLSKSQCYENRVLYVDILIIFFFYFCRQKAAHPQVSFPLCVCVWERERERERERESAKEEENVRNFIPPPPPPPPPPHERKIKYCKNFLGIVLSLLLHLLERHLSTYVLGVDFNIKRE